MVFDEASAEGASFRDPRGQVFYSGDRVLRRLSADAAVDFGWLESTGLLEALIRKHGLIKTWRIAAAATADADREPRVETIEHERIPFVSYPYEWPFSALKAAAVYHLELHLAALDAGASLSDATAYNVQFDGTTPRFIDIPSLRPYRDGEYWFGHQQFLNQFLNPLLLDSLAGIAFQRYYRGSLEGIPSRDLNCILSPLDRIRPSVVQHVSLPVWMQRMSARSSGSSAARAMDRRKLPKAALIQMLRSLERTIRRLEPGSHSVAGWDKYTVLSSYTGAEHEAKRSFIAAYAAATKPKMLCDIGCNTGAYSAIALEAGAARVIGLELDPAAADLAFRHAQKNGLSMLPLVVDLADASPSQGWRGRERHSLAERARFDGLIALAVEHHLAIGRNIPLDQLVDEIVSLAPNGVIEFVPNSDPQVQRLLSLRESDFATHSIEAFTASITSRARIERSAVISASGRQLIWYDRQ